MTHEASNDVEPGTRKYSYIEKLAVQSTAQKVIK
jgi:hypothetical protein